MNLYVWILTLAIIAGQLIKLPLTSSGGATALDVTILILCVAGLFRLKFKLKKPPLFVKGALIFILIAIFSLILTPLKLQLSEYLGSSLYIVRFGAYILLGWEIYSGAYSSLKKTAPQVFIFSGLGLAILGLLQLIFLPDLRFLSEAGWDPHYFRTVSTFLDPNFTGAYLALTLLLLIAYRGDLLPPRIFYIFFALIYLALVTTFSRGAYLTFSTSFLAFSFLQKSFKLGILTAVLSLGLLLGFSIYQKNVAEPRGVNRTESAEFRLGTWQQGITLFQNNPVLGVGFNAYRYSLKQYNLGGQNFLSSHGASTNDSSLLFVAATTGIIGLLGFLFFLFSLIKSNKHKPILIAGLLGLVIQSFFTNTLFYPPLLTWIILMSATIQE